MLRGYSGRFFYVVLLMTAFNFFSHGTQDLYPTFLRLQHHFNPHTIGLIAIVYNIGAILGGMTFGALSERIGRRRGIVIAALGALFIIPLWAYGTSPIWLATGAFFMQFAVQGAWGIVPVHLNELSPHEVRGTFPGFAYQTRQFARLRKCHPSGIHCPSQRRKLRLRAGFRRGDCRGRACLPRRLRHRSAWH